MSEWLDQLSQLSPGALAAIAAASGAAGVICGAVITAVIGRIIVTPFLSARDKQDKESEWRRHALELTKLDLERKLKSRADLFKHPPRPSIIDFLANYRDLQELDSKTPRELFKTIESQRTSKKPAVST